jgi:hypothetical protein
LGLGVEGLRRKGVWGLAVSRETKREPAAYSRRLSRHQMLVRRIGRLPNVEAFDHVNIERATSGASGVWRARASLHRSFVEPHLKVTVYFIGRC